MFILWWDTVSVKLIGYILSHALHRNYPASFDDVITSHLVVLIHMWCICQLSNRQRVFKSKCNPSSAGHIYIDVLVQNRCNSITNALELLRSCTKPSIYGSVLNSLWPSDTTWRHKSGSTLAQVMAWCRQAPSQYLNKYWFKAQWHSSECNLTTDASAISHWN